MIKKLFSSELMRGSLVLFIMFNTFNFLNFLFHFSMARMLGPAEYGVLAVLMSMAYVYSVPSEAIQNLISKFTSKFNYQKKKRKIKFLLIKGLQKSFFGALLVFLILIFVSIFLSDFLEINFFLILLTNLLLFSSFSIPVVRGVLQGRKKFFMLGWSMIIESILKLFFSVSLVILGFKVFGAVTGVLIGIFSGIIFSLYFNKDILAVKKEKVPVNGLYLQSVPYFVSMFVVLLVMSLDIILAKRFFSPELAGQYSVLSMLGKMIFFGTVAISKTMFPLTSEQHEKKKSSKELFRKSFFMVFALCLVGILVYFIIPKIVIGILYGAQYVDMAPYLGYSGLALSFLSLSNLVLIYGLSTNRLKNTQYLFVFLGIEVLLLSLFHSTILEYILAFMVSNIIMFIGSFFFVKRKAR